MKATQFKYRIPDTDDKNFWGSINYNWRRSSAHSHEGLDSAKLNPYSIITTELLVPVVGTAEATGWVAEGSLFRNTVNVPSSYDMPDWDVNRPPFQFTIVDQFGSPQGNEISAGGTKEVSTVTTTADTLGSLNNTYFILPYASGTKAFWFNVNGAGFEPIHGATVGIEVAIATDETADNVAIAVSSAADTDDAFTATEAGSVVSITDAQNGIRSGQSAGDSGFTVVAGTDGTDGTGQVIVVWSSFIPSEDLYILF